MFYNYENIRPDYIPDNTSPKPSDSYVTIDNDKLPKRICNAKGNFIGYGWNYGDVFDMKFSVARKIKVYEDSILFHRSGVEPTTATPGKPGSQVFNIVDGRSWTCAKFESGLYIWVEDDVLTYPEDGDKEIAIPEDMSDCSIYLDVVDTRWEPVHTFSSFSSAEIVVSVNKDITDLFKPGAYYCTLRVTSSDSSYLKDKFMFIVY